MAGCICYVDQGHGQCGLYSTRELELELVRHAALTHLGADVMKDEAKLGLPVCVRSLSALVFGCGRLDSMVVASG